MRRSKVVCLLAVAAMAALGLIGQALSQESRPAESRETRGSDRMRERIEQFRQQAAGRLKEALGATDDEWKILQPKIENVQTLARQTQGGASLRTFGRGRNAADRSDEGASQSDVEKKMLALTKLLENKDANPRDIKTALAAYREARDKAKEELAKAQKELGEILTVRQEAQLVIWRLLD